MNKCCGCQGEHIDFVNRHCLRRANVQERCCRVHRDWQDAVSVRGGAPHRLHLYSRPLMNVLDWDSCAGSAPVWSARDGQDAAGARSGAPHRLHLHPGVGQRAGAEVHRGGLPHGPRALRHGQVCAIHRHQSFASLPFSLAATFGCPRGPCAVSCQGCVYVQKRTGVTWELVVCPM